MSGVATLGYVESRGGLPVPAPPRSAFEEVIMPDSFVVRVQEVCSNATAQIVKAKPMYTAQRIRWTDIAARDVTSSPTAVEVGFMVSDSRFVVKCAAPGAAHRTVEQSIDLTLSGSWVPFARFLGATSADQLELYAYGQAVD